MITALKNGLNDINVKLLGAFAAFVTLATIANVSSFCAFWFHQPKMPSSVQNLRAK